MKMWYHFHLSDWSLYNWLIHTNVGSTGRSNDGITARFEFTGKQKCFLVLDLGCRKSHTWWRDVNVSSAS